MQQSRAHLLHVESAGSVLGTTVSRELSREKSLSIVVVTSKSKENKKIILLLKAQVLNCFSWFLIGNKQIQNIVWKLMILILGVGLNSSAWGHQDYSLAVLGRTHTILEVEPRPPVYARHELQPLSYILLTLSKAFYIQLFFTFITTGDETMGNEKDSCWVCIIDTDKFK